MDIEGENNVENFLVQILNICINRDASAGFPVHIIQECFPAVWHGIKSLKAINNLTVKIIDLNGELNNLRNDLRSMRLHFRKISN